MTFRALLWTRSFVVVMTVEEDAGTSTAPGVETAGRLLLFTLLFLLLLLTLLMLFCFGTPVFDNGRRNRCIGRPISRPCAGRMIIVVPEEDTIKHPTSSETSNDDILATVFVWIGFLCVVGDGVGVVVVAVIGVVVLLLFELLLALSWWYGMVDDITGRCISRQK